MKVHCRVDSEGVNATAAEFMEDLGVAVYLPGTWFEPDTLLWLLLDEMDALGSQPLCRFDPWTG